MEFPWAMELNPTDNENIHAAWWSTQNWLSPIWNDLV
jgi:hypothetical protein